MRKVVCGTPLAECKGTFISIDKHPSKAHSTSAEAFECYCRHLIRHGYVKVGNREFQRPGEPVRVLRKPSKFGMPLRMGKGGEGMTKGNRYTRHGKPGQRSIVVTSIVAMLTAVVPAAAEPLRCTVNVTGDAWHPAHRARGWASGPVIDLRVRPDELHGFATPAEQWEAMRDHAGQVGRYLTWGCEQRDRIIDYPAEAVSCESFAPSELIGDPATVERVWPDIKQPAVRAKLAALMIDEIQRHPECPYVLVDNVVAYSVAVVPFDDQLVLLKTVSEAVDAKIIPNIAGRIDRMTDTQALSIGGSTDGSAWEIAIHPSIRDDAQAMERWRTVVKRWMLMGDLVVMMSINKALTTDDERKAEANYVAEQCADVRDSSFSGTCMVHWNFHWPSPDWAISESSEPMVPLPLTDVLRAGITPIEIPAGEYVFEEGITIPPNTEITWMPGARSTFKMSRRPQRFMPATSTTPEIPEVLSNAITLSDGARWTAHGADFAVEWVGSGDNPEPFECGLMVMYISGTDDIRISGGTYRNGGDGIWIGPNWHGGVRDAPEDITIDGVLCTDNWRQGLTISSGRRVTVRDSFFGGSKGYSPQAGIDIEPPSAEDFVDAIRFERCTSKGNESQEYAVNVARLTQTSYPVSVDFTDCKAYPIRQRGLYVNGFGLEDPTPAPGYVSWDDSIIYGSKP